MYATTFYDAARQRGDGETREAGLSPKDNRGRAPSGRTRLQNDYLGNTVGLHRDGKVDPVMATPFGHSLDKELRSGIKDRRFTGKPYDADLAGFVFPFRNYSTTTSRWTTADPSGFPDGPNSHFYAPVPTMGLDPLGLAHIEVWEQTTWQNAASTLENWVRDLIGWDTVYGAAHYLKLSGDFNESNHQFYSHAVDSAEGMYTFTTAPVAYELNVSDVTSGQKILEDGTSIKVLTMTSQYRAYFGIEFEGVQFSFDLASDTITLQIEAES